MRTILKLAALAVFLPLWPGQTLACSCLPPTLASVSGFSDIVIEGTVLKVRRSRNSVKATVRIVRALKGSPGRIILVQTPADSAACGVAFRKGQSVRFGASKTGGMFNTSLCSQF